MTAATSTTQGSGLDLNQVLQSIDELPTIPETLIEILKVLDDPDSGPSDLAQVVRLDAPLMSKILRLANSPYYSSRGDIGDINRCVAVLGYRTVRQVAICVSVATNLVAAVSKSKGRLDYRELWKHSVVTGAVAKHLAKQVGYEDPEEAFTMGLLHDLGKFVLLIYAPEAYDKVVADRGAANRPLWQVEKEAFGFSHPEMAGAFARSWHLPARMIPVFEGHHPREETVGAAQDSEQLAVAIVALADYLANTMEPPRSDLGFDPRLVSVAGLHEAAGLTVSQVQEQLPALRDEIALSMAYLELS